MATKHHPKKENDLEEETDELKDSEIAEMGEEEGILMPKNSEDMEELDDTKSEEVAEEEEE